MKTNKPAEISLSDKKLDYEKALVSVPEKTEYIFLEKDIREAVQKYFEALDFNASEKRKIIEIGKAKSLLNLIFGRRLTTDE